MDIRRTEKVETYTRQVPYLVIELSVAEVRDLYEDIRLPNFETNTMRDLRTHFTAFLATPDL